MHRAIELAAIQRIFGEAFLERNGAEVVSDLGNAAQVRLRNVSGSFYVTVATRGGSTTQVFGRRCEAVRRFLTASGDEVQSLPARSDCR